MDLLWSGRGRRVGRSVSLAAGTGRSLSGLLANGLDRFAEHPLSQIGHRIDGFVAQTLYEVEAVVPPRPVQLV